MPQDPKSYHIVSKHDNYHKGKNFAFAFLFMKKNKENDVQTQSRLFE